MKKLIALIFCIGHTGGQAQLMATYQPVHKQPNVQFDYWVYSTHAGNGNTSQYPSNPTNLNEMNAMFNTSNTNSTLVQTGTTNSARILDWTSAAELSAIGINVPNGGTNFGLRIQGTFIPLESGTYTFTISSDDASDLFIDGTSVIVTYSGQAVQPLGTRTGSINLTAGRAYSFIARMQQGGGGFGFRMYWRSPTQNATIASGYTTNWAQNVQEIITTPYMDGSSAAKAAPNAKYIQTAFNNFTDGTYWINLPFVGPTQVFCILNSAVDGGGWMMAMKATRGTTFQYSSSHWTSVTTLNTGNTNRNDGDAKFHTMNYFAAKDILALWPDITTVGGSLSLNGYGCWSWLQNNFNNGVRITPIIFFSSVNNLFLGDANNFAGKGSVFSSQVDVRFYGFNYTANSTGANRWGFGWNENGGGLYPNGNQASNDVYGGIGMAAGSYSAGDFVACCDNVRGINRSARVEIYIR